MQRLEQLVRLVCCQGQVLERKGDRALMRARVMHCHLGLQMFRDRFQLKRRLIPIDEQDHGQLLNAADSQCFSLKIEEDEEEWRKLALLEVEKEI